jgi:hypothetical protein
MLGEGGSVPAGDPVPEAQPPDRLLNRVADAYDDEARAIAEEEEAEKAAEEGGATSAPRPVLLDRARLARMVALRRHFFKRFAARAKEEGMPADMSWFIGYTERWLARAEEMGAREA